MKNKKSINKVFTLQFLVDQEDFYEKPNRIFFKSENNL